MAKMAKLLAYTATVVLAPMMGLGATGQSLHGTLEVVTLTPDGGFPNGPSTHVSSDDHGRYLAFWSAATDITPQDPPPCVETDGPEPPTCYGLYIWARHTQQVTRVPAGPMSFPTKALMSGDGSTVVFSSLARNLVPEDDDDFWDVFAFDRASGRLDWVSRPIDSFHPASAENESSAGLGGVTPDGRFVVFSSSWSDLVDNDTNGVADVFVRDRLERTTERVSLADGGRESNGPVGGLGLQSISADGRWVVFTSQATDLVSGPKDECTYEPPPGYVLPCFHAYAVDRTMNRTLMLDVSPDGSPSSRGAFVPAISRDGTLALFTSASPELGDAAGQEQVFVRRIEANTTELASVNRRGEPSNQSSGSGWFSADGTFVSFLSGATNTKASNLDLDEEASGMHTYVRGLASNVTRRITASDPAAGALDGHLVGNGARLMALTVTLRDASGDPRRVSGFLDLEGDSRNPSVWGEDCPQGKDCAPAPATRRTGGAGMALALVALFCLVKLVTRTTNAEQKARPELRRASVAFVRRRPFAYERRRDQ